MVRSMAEILCRLTRIDCAEREAVAWRGVAQRKRYAPSCPCARAAKAALQCPRGLGCQPPRPSGLSALSLPIVKVEGWIAGRQPPAAQTCCRRVAHTVVAFATLVDCFFAATTSFRVNVANESPARRSVNGANGIPTFKLKHTCAVLGGAALARWRPPRPGVFPLRRHCGLRLRGPGGSLLRSLRLACRRHGGSMQERCDMPVSIASHILTFGNAASHWSASS